MVLPGWNVSEPIDLAFKLYRVIESLKSAPEEAKAFVSKINKFSRSLRELQKTIENDVATRSSAQDLDHLRETLEECQDCVKRCEEFGERFRNIAKDGAGSLRGAREATRFVWQDKKVTRLRKEIDDQMNGIGLSLMIKTFTDSRSRQGSESPAVVGLHSPRRTETYASLPPYSPPSEEWEQEDSQPRAKTPAQLLGLKIEYEGGNADTKIKSEKSRALLESDDISPSKIFASPQSSPNALRPMRSSSELDKFGALRPLESRRNTETEVASPPDALGILNDYSTSPSTLSRVFTSPSGFSIAPSRKQSSGEATSPIARQDSFFSLDACCPEVTMSNLNGAKISFYKSKSRISYPVTSIESFRDVETGRRFIVITPPVSSNIKLYLFPPSERVIPHTEHPEAYGATKYRVKFVEPYLLTSQKLSMPRKPSDGALNMMTPLTVASSAASGSSFPSLGSPTLTNKDNNFKTESQRQEYDFVIEDDYWTFQELLMGPNIKLQLQVPIELITSKRYEENKTSKQSELQYLRLWQCGRHQYLMFFANSSSAKYKEYKMEYFRPVDAKSKTLVKLEVHMPGTIRRGSKSKSPIIISEQLPETGLIGDTDFEDLKKLDCLSIEFSHAEDKIAFLHKARFHSLAEDHINIAPFAFQSRASTA